MASSKSRSVRSQVLVIIALLILVLVLGAAYWFLTRPASVSNQLGDRDRNYLFSIYGFEGDLLRRPAGVGVAPNGDIHVADTGKHRIVVFDEDGDFITSYGDPGEGATQLVDPIDVAITATGRSFVVDKTQSKIVIYDDGQPVNAIAFAEEAPLGVTIADDQLFVTTESGVVIGDLDGNFITGYVERGKEPGQFDRPAAVAVGEDGTLYICDSLNYRIQAISSSGLPLWQYGEPIPADQAIQFQGESRKFGLPASIALSEQGRLYVVDGLNSEIAVLDTNGELLETFGDVGHDDGFFYYPDGIDYADGKLVIADRFNDRVQVFREPTIAGEWTTYVPYALLALLLPLLLIPLLLRRRRYVAAPSFVSAAEADEAGTEVLSRLKRLYGTEVLGLHVASLDDVDVDWRDQAPDNDKVRELMETYDLGEEEAQALYITTAIRGKRVLLAEEGALREAARDLDLPTATFAEIKEALGKEGETSQMPEATDTADAQETPADEQGEDE